jgi:hypothetical protein
MENIEESDDSYIKDKLLEYFSFWSMDENHENLHL